MRKISDVFIHVINARATQNLNSPRKHPASLNQAYTNAPYFYEHLQFLETLFSTASGRLIDFNLAVIRHLMLNLGLDTDIIRQSELSINAAGDRMLIEICRHLGASVYLASAIAGRHLNAALFEKAGIELRLVKDPSPIYPQLWGDFIPDLSAFDLLFNCGPKARDILLGQ